MAQYHKKYNNNCHSVILDFRTLSTVPINKFRTLKGVMSTPVIFM